MTVDGRLNTDIRKNHLVDSGEANTRLIRIKKRQSLGKESSSTWIVRDFSFSSLSLKIILYRLTSYPRHNFPIISKNTGTAIERSSKTAREDEWKKLNLN